MDSLNPPGMRHLPPRPFLDDIVRTSLWIWLGLHVAVAIGGAQLTVSPVVSLALLAILVGVAHLDRSSRGMTLLLANLGFSPRQVTLLVLGVGGAAEIVLQLLVRLVR